MEKSLLIVRETKFGFRYVFKRLEFEPIWSGSKKHTCGNSVSLQPLYLFDSQHFNAFFKLPSSKLRHLGSNHDSATVPVYSAKPPWNYSWGFCQSTQLLDEWQKLSTAHMIRLHKKITRESNKEIEWRSHVSYLTLQMPPSTPCKTLGNKTVSVSLLFWSSAVCRAEVSDSWEGVHWVLGLIVYVWNKKHYMV